MGQQTAPQRPTPTPHQQSTKQQQQEQRRASSQDQSPIATAWLNEDLMREAVTILDELDTLIHEGDPASEKAVKQVIEM